LLDLWNFSLEELTDWLAELGERPFRAKQLYGWMYGKGVSSFDEMTDISAATRKLLAEKACLDSMKPADSLFSKDGNTSKFLLETSDGHFIETVFMKYKDRNSLCVSAQVGCKRACKFCASGALGLKRNLTAGELAQEVILSESLAGAKTKNIVLMGIGEPLDNFDNIKQFIVNLSDEHGRDFSRRAFTLSTSGVVPMFARLAEELPQVNLAVSLHAPNDALREQIMPITKKWGVAEIVEATKKHYAATRRRATFEYALIKGFNDSAAQARELAKLLKGINCLVNLIPLNDGSKYKGTSENAAQKFREILGENHIPATVRLSLGADIEAACGQLRLRHEDGKAERK